jgi:hypothetical protein
MRFVARPRLTAAGATVGYAPATINHDISVLKGFDADRIDSGLGPLVNPVPDTERRQGRRSSPHHNPMQPYDSGRPRALLDRMFDALFAVVGCDRDRALLAFWISTGALPSKAGSSRLSPTCTTGWPRPTNAAGTARSKASRSALRELSRNSRRCAGPFGHGTDPARTPKSLGIAYDWIGIAEITFDAFHLHDFAAGMDHIWCWRTDPSKPDFFQVTSCVQVSPQCCTTCRTSDGRAHPDLGTE